MKESPTSPVRPLASRLTADFAFYDQNGSHLWRSWREGEIVTDVDAIKFLESHSAPVEKIELKDPQ